MSVRVCQRIFEHTFESPRHAVISAKILSFGSESSANMFAMIDGSKLGLKLPGSAKDA